jgi:Probable cobalt transporter subunit (CbtA)
MIAAFFVRGLVVGLLAGLLAGGFAFAFGEPQVDHAIALEEATAQAAAAEGSAGGDAGHSHAAEEEPPVSRTGQKGGLFLALALYGAAVGGLFGLAYAAVRGRVGRLSEPALAVALSGALFLAVVVVPFLKYPANPPAVGDPETIAMRTTTYLLMVVIGLVALAAAIWAGRSVPSSAPESARVGAVLAGFLVPVAVAFVALPSVNEVPDGFPASLLWDFRVASLGTQLVLWTALGALFALVTERAARRRVPVQATA